MYVLLVANYKIINLVLKIHTVELYNKCDELNVQEMLNALSGTIQKKD